MNSSSAKFQHPSSREFSSIKLLVGLCLRLAPVLKFGIWGFFGAWTLALGASTFIFA
jgi:hypothetical protein